MRLHRLLGIMMLLDSRGTMKAGHLAKILETSERSIYRDIDLLCESGIPIMSTPGPNGGYSFMENYKINSNVLESGDAVNLLLSGMGIIPEKNTEMSQKLKNALIKLENSVSEEHRYEIIKAKERFFIDSSPWWGKNIQHKYIDTIKQSVLTLKKLKIYYKKYTGEVSERIVRPYGVVIKNAHWYVVAFCEIKRDIRVFKCNRIETIEVLNESFSMPEHFHLEDFWGKSKQHFVGQSSQKVSTSAYPVKMKCYHEKKHLPEGFDVSSSYQIENYWVYVIDMISFQTACHVVFPLSDYIEVLEPIQLREYILQKAYKISALYENK